VVAAADGLTDEFQLRQGKPKEPPPQAQAKREPRRAKTLFELLFGF
jgi:hypothetical protein